MNNIISILAKDSSGFFSGAQGIVGIVLVLTGIAMIYIAIKVMKGYQILPMQETCQPKEDTYLPEKAKVINKQETEIPSFNGGEVSFMTEWTIEYTVEGETYEQIIPDDNYSKGDILDVKYNPENPKEYYLDNGIIMVEKSEDEEEEEEKEKLEKNPIATAMIIVAVLLMTVGVVMIIDKVM
ncbi:MAG: hypothetical protein ACI4I6_05170 [Hominimerdicola sp.]